MQLAGGVSFQELTLEQTRGTSEAHPGWQKRVYKQSCQGELPLQQQRLLLSAQTRLLALVVK